MFFNTFLYTINDNFPVYFLGFSLILSNLFIRNDSGSVIEMASFEVLINLVRVIVKQIPKNQSNGINWDLKVGSRQKKFVVESFLIRI